MSQADRKGPNRRVIALGVSVLLNLFLLAVIGGHLVRAHRLEARGGFPMAVAIARLEASLPPQDSQTLEASLRRDAPRYAQPVRELRAARRDFDAAIAAEPYDRARAAEALARWRAAWGRFMDAFQDPLLDAIGQISPEGRKRLMAGDRRWGERRTPRP